MEVNDKTTFVARDLENLPPLRIDNMDSLKMLREIETIKSQVAGVTLIQNEMMGLITKNKELYSMEAQTTEKCPTINDENLESTSHCLTEVEDQPNSAADCSFSSGLSSTFSIPCGQGDPVQKSKNDDSSSSADDKDSDNHQCSLRITTPVQRRIRPVRRNQRYREIENRATQTDVTPSHQKKKTYNKMPPKMKQTQNLARQIIGSGPAQQLKLDKTKKTNERTATSKRVKQAKQQDDKRLVTGAGPKDLLKTVKRKKSPDSTKVNRTCTGIFVTRLKPKCTTNQLNKHIKLASGYSIRAQKLPTKYDTYSSFYIPCDRSMQDNMFDPDIWPQEALVREFFS